MIASLLSSLLPTVRSSPAGTASRGRPQNVALGGQVLSLDSPDGWDAILSDRESESGVRVNHHIALTLPPLWQGISIISGDIATMTLDCFRRVDGGDREICHAHPAEFLVSTEANEDTTAFEFWRRVLVHAILWGNGYAWIDRDPGPLRRPLQMVNLLPDRTFPRYDNRGRLYYVTEVDGRLEPLLKDEVLHVKGLSVHNSIGHDLLLAARDAIGLALAAQNYASKFFSNGSQMGGILTIPATFSEKAAAKLEEGFRRKFSRKEDWFAVCVLRDGAKFEASTIDAQKSQQTELRRYQREEVASLLNLPGFKLGVQGSVSYNSAEQGQIAYLVGCLNHWRMAVSSECGMKLLAPEEKRTHYFEHNASVLLEMDTMSLNAVLEIQRRNEIISANEWRRKLNMARRNDPGGDEYANPNTKSPTDASAVPTAQRDLLDVPDRRQGTPYSCGAACVWAVADFFVVGAGRTERAYIRELHCTPRDGTAPEAIIDWFTDAGLFATAGAGMTLADLERFAQQGQPVICPVQMYGPGEGVEQAGNAHGHYVVVLGVALGQVIFHDPVAGRSLLSASAFDAVWHDQEEEGVAAVRFGIAIGKSLVAAPEEETDTTPEEVPAPGVPPETPVEGEQP